MVPHALSDISFVLHAIHLFHPNPPPYISLLSECPRASLPGAEGALSVTLHHFKLDSTVFTALHVYVYVRQRHGIKRHQCACRGKLRLSIWVQDASLGGLCMYVWGHAFLGHWAGRQLRKEGRWVGAGHLIVTLTFGLLISSLQEKRERSSTCEESSVRRLTQQWCVIIS